MLMKKTIKNSWPRICSTKCLVFLKENQKLVEKKNSELEKA